MTRGPVAEVSARRSLLYALLGSSALHGTLIFVPLPNGADLRGERGGSAIEVVLVSEEPSGGLGSPAEEAPPSEAVATQGEPAEVPATGEDAAVLELSEDVPVALVGGSAAEAPEAESLGSRGEGGASSGIAGSGEAGAGGYGSGGEGSEGGTAPRFRPPKLLTIVYPLTLEEAENLPSPLEIEVRLLIGTDGRVLRVEPEGPELPRELFEALDRSAREMRFRPALDRGEPVEAWTTTTVVYRR